MEISQSVIITLIRGRAQKGMNVKQMVDHLASDSDLGRTEIRRVLRPVLKDLVNSGQVVIGRGKRYFAAEATETVSGRVRVVASGYGSVVPETEGGALIRIEKSGLRGAMDGDRVLVRIEVAREKARREGQREGVVLRVLERVRTTLVGRWIRNEQGRPYVRPINRRLGARVLISGSEIGGEPDDGEFVLVGLERVSVRGKTRGRLVERLGRSGEPGVDDQVVLRSVGIDEAFSEAVLDQVRRIPGEIAENEEKGRWDLRDQPAVTVDPETARDFDDAVFAKPGRRGAILVDVHIADVAHYVVENSALDLSARDRSTSVYLPNHVVPMLPERLSSDLCSLKPGVDRLAFTVRFEVLPNGELGTSEARPSIIRSRRRCVYEEVRDWLDSSVWPKDTTEIADSLWLCSEASERLLEARKRRGGLDFDLSEPKLVFDAKGRVIDIVSSERTRAHRMIEELMVASNRCIARMLIDKEQDALHRVHDRPDPKRLSELAATLSGLGIKAQWSKGDVEASHLQALLEEVIGKPSGPLISSLVLRSLARAVYSSDPQGHFALAADAYCHFTSPIRRYPDIIVHRALRRLQSGEKSNSAIDFVALGAHCSEREQRAESAERMAVMWKVTRFLADKVGEVFDGRVSGVTSFGFFVTLDRFAVDGLVHIAEMVDDYYEFDPGAHCLVGTGGGRRWRLGDAAKVRITYVDEEAMQIQMLPAEMKSDGHTSKKGNRPANRPSQGRGRPAKSKKKGRRTRK